MSIWLQGYTIDDDQALNSVDGGRRLSVGSDIAGMFNFIDQYDYKCESQPKPLRMLDPPFAFTIDLYQMCEKSACYSGLDVLKENASSKVKLPGWSRDPHMSDSFVKGMFIKSREEVYSIGPDKVITIQDFRVLLRIGWKRNDFFGKQICYKTSLQWLAISHCAQRKDKFWNGRKLKGIHPEAEAHCHRLWNEDVLRMQKEEEFCFSKPKLSVKREGLS